MYPLSQGASNRILWQTQVAIGLVVLAVALRFWPFHDLGTRIPFLTLYPAVIIAALLGGLSSGLQVTVLSSVFLLNWAPAGQPFISDSSEALGLVFFTITGVIISLMAEAMYRTRARLVESERDFRSLAENVPDNISRHNLDGSGIYMNPVLERTLGCPAHEVLGRPMHEVFPDGRFDRLEYAIRKVGATGDSMEIEQVIPNKEGGMQFHAIRIVAELGQEGRPVSVLALGRDLTKQRLVEQELENHRNNLQELVDERTRELVKAKETAEVANVAKSAFLANMSHEMRTPLHQISGLAQLVKREPLTAKQTNRIERLDTACSHMTTIVEGMLELARLEANAITLSETPIAVGDLLNDTALAAEELASAKELELITIAGEVPTNLLGDANYLKLALRNYLNNAIRFSQVGPVTLRNVLVEEDDHGALIRFEVEDNGIGIDAEAKTRLFSIFEQVDNSSTRKYGGAGLGLAMTKKLAQMMGGDAGCESTPGHGSTFWFTVRLRKG